MSVTRLLLVLVVLSAVGTSEAFAHGTTLTPASRNYVCRFLDRASEPCAAAWDRSPQALYDWMGVLIARADGRHRELIPDGQLCGAGDPKFGALNRASGGWLATQLQPGRQTFRWVLNAPHATRYYRFYITREGYDPARPVGWDDLELIHDSGRRGANELESFGVDVPARTGRHVVFSVWQRSDSPEAFYACSDVVFGAAGQVPLNPPLSDESANQPGGSGHAGHGSSSKAAGKPLRLSSAGIRLRRKIDSDWGAGYCATVTVTNRAKRTRAWKASMAMPHRITGLWNAKHAVRRGRLQVRGESYNRTLRPGRSTTFGFCATR